MTPTKTLGTHVRRVTVALAVVAMAGVAASAAKADEIRDMEWHLDHLDMSTAWDVTDGAGITVAVLDTGVDADHPDFGDAVVPGIDLTASGDGTVAYDDHGTAMAGLIAARGRGGDGIKGIAPGATILPVTINDSATAAEGLRWATDHGADVINVSGGTDFEDNPEVRAATAYALSKDVVVVASAGNDGGTRINFPGGYDGVITVSALTEQDELTDVSSYGPEVDLAAPGDVVSLAADGAYYETGGGSSAATAITSGVVALVRAQFPDLDAANVVNRMIATGRDVGAPGEDDESGFGIVDPVAALTAEVPAVSENPLGSPEGGGGEATEPPNSEPEATQPPATESDPCATSTEPGPAGGDGPAPAGMLTLGDECDEFVGVSPASSNNTLGIVVALGIGVVVLAGLAMIMLRRRRPGPQSPVPAYGVPGAPPPGAGQAPAGWQGQPGSGPQPGGWQAPARTEPPPSAGWQPPPQSGPPPR